VNLAQFYIVRINRSFASYDLKIPISLNRFEYLFKAMEFNPQSERGARRQTSNAEFDAKNCFGVQMHDSYDSNHHGPNSNLESRYHRKNAAHAPKLQPM
jgi:hypothetical protein